MLDLKNKSILVTGGTGSFGKAFIQKILNSYPEVKRIVVFSRDELKQYDMASSAPFDMHLGKLRFFIGDIRDSDRLNKAFRGIDYVIHAAALKQVPAAEYNPMECIKTNIFGTENVINAAIYNGVKKVIGLSTDKAAAPVNLYGASKLCADKLMTAANNIVGDQKTSFAVVRYGNVVASRGSVIPLFLKHRGKGVLPITHKDMTRFSITLEKAIELVLLAIDKSWGGEIFVPKIPSYRILDVARAISPEAKLNFIGVRPGEKLHEEMITQDDSPNTLEFKDYYVIIPTTLVNWTPEMLMERHQGKRVSDGFCYNSSNNSQWLSVQELRHQIQEITGEEIGIQ